MYRIQRLTDNPRQAHTLFLPDGTSFYIELTFKPIQTGWFFDLTYGDRVINGMRLVTSPNCLRQFKDVLPFGLACYSRDSRDPAFREDFSSGAIELYITTRVEVEQLERYLNDA